MDAQSTSGAGNSTAVSAYVEEVFSWYAGYVRPFFEDLASDRIEELDRDVQRIRSLSALFNEERAVCFLGNSGVGKSTLINALVAGKERILPQGGIGPLTAQATSVRYAEQPFFEATYQPPRNLHNVLFGLERYYEALLRRQGKETVPSDVALDNLVDPEEKEDLEAEAKEAGGAIPDRIAAYQKQVRLLIKNNQDADVELPYLLDGLRMALGQAARWGSALAPDDQKRIERIGECIAQPKGRREVSGDGRFPFLHDLREHASGFLAPLIKTLDVGWDSPLLKDGLVLVDLPGLGVANDEYRNRTHDWVRNKARGIALVVGKSGVKEAEAELLRTSGFFNRLLHSVDDFAADPVDLLVIVVQLDLSATDEWRDDRDQNDGKARRKWFEHFEDVCERAKTVVASQLREQLSKFSGATSSIKGDVQTVVSKVLEGLQVYAVCAPEYAKCLADDDEDRARIVESGQSRIPQLQKAIREIALKREQELERRLQENTELFGQRLRSGLELIRAQWEGEERATHEAEQLRSELELFLDPLRRDLYSRQGAFREFLKKTLPAQIETLVEKARSTAEAEINEYLAALEDAHWATLRAAVRRGGVFMGARQVDLPNDFALRFEEPVAVVWAKQVLAILRKRTSELADDYVAFVEQVAQWVEGKDVRVQARLLHALRDQIKADTKQLSTVGKEAVDELRGKVKSQLLAKIQGPIRNRCQRFVESKMDQGTGTKRRILEFFEKLVPLVVDSAKETATRVLQSNYDEVQGEIREVFKNHPDPLKTAADSIVASHEERVRRSDARRRKEVLETIATVFASDPGSTGSQEKRASA